MAAARGGGGGNFSGATNLDAIAEVNVQMASYTAEYGLKGGAQVNFITKHGGSDYHGVGLHLSARQVVQLDQLLQQAGGPAQAGVPLLDARRHARRPRAGSQDGSGQQKLFFFYSIDDTRLDDVNVLRRFMMPTAAERNGDFSQTRTPAGGLIAIRDPLTNLPFPNNVIPLNRADPRSLALLNMLPMPNTTGSGYNFVDQEPSIPHPRRQHLLRVDFRPTVNDTISVKGQTWFTKSVGINVAGASARWGLVRQRYDFTADQAKIDYTRILGSHTVIEANWGVFDSHEDGPPENSEQLARIQRSSFPALAGLPQFAAGNNPLNIIPKATWGNFQSSGSADYIPNVTYDNRWPITGHDYAIPMSVNVTHSRGAHTFKAGLLREREMFQQARSGVFGGRIQLLERCGQPQQHRLRVFERVPRPGHHLYRVDGPRRRLPPADQLCVVRAGHVEAALVADARSRAADVQVPSSVPSQRRVLDLFASRSSIRPGAAGLPCSIARSRRRMGAAG